MSEAKQLTCEQRIDAHWEIRKTDLWCLFHPWDVPVEILHDFIEGQTGKDITIDEYDDDCESQKDALIEESMDQRYDYGLSFDYVAPETFSDQLEGYWRYQFSWGGPSDELRLYSSDQVTLYRAEYWFMDWGDGARRNVRDDIVTAVWENFVETEMVKSTYETYNG